MNDIDILITAALPPFLYDPLKADYRCHDHAQANDKDLLLAEVGARVRGLVQGGGTVTPTALLDSLPALEIISVFGVGYDGVPTDYCRKRGIKVTNTPDVLTDDVADVAVALILMTGRGFVRANRFVHAGEWLRRGPELTMKLGGRSVGILGLGRIGKAIAQRVRAMQMHVAYTGRKPQDVEYEYVADLKSLAAQVDFLVVACPGGPATRHLVDEGVLAALGRQGTLINIARGSIVDEAALARALADGHDQGRRSRRVRERAEHSRGTARDRQRRAAAARRQRHAGDAPGDGRPLQGEPRSLVRGTLGSDAHSRARLSGPRGSGEQAPISRPGPAARRSRACRLAGTGR